VDEYDAFSNDFLEPYNTTWDGTAVERTFKSFWSMFKSLLSKNRISRVFIAGISPLSLTDIGSGFNVARNISFDW
jgi:Predicted AAA-ATPase